MKKSKVSLIVLGLILGLTPVLFAYISNPYGNPSKQDAETTWATAGDTLTQGMVVVTDYSYNSYTTPKIGVDTAAVVIRATVENDSRVAGIAMSDATPGQSVKILTRGVYACKVDGSDSNANQNPPIATILSPSDRDGFLGSIWADSSASAVTILTEAQKSTYLSQGDYKFVLQQAVATNDTGAITTYDVYVDCR